MSDDKFNCRKCPIANECNVPLYQKNADLHLINSRLLIITEKPSQEDNDIQLGFYDRHFKFLQKMVGDNYHAPVAYSYAVKCYTKKLTVKQAEICSRSWLSREVSLFNQIPGRSVLIMGQLPFNICRKYLNEKFGLIGDFKQNMGYNQATRTGVAYAPVHYFNRGVKHHQTLISLLKSIKESHASVH